MEHFQGSLFSRQKTLPNLVIYDLSLTQDFAVHKTLQHAWWHFIFLTATKRALLLANHHFGFSSVTTLSLTSMQKWSSLLHSVPHPWARGQEGPRPPPGAAESFSEAGHLNTWPRLDPAASRFLIGTDHRGDCISAGFPKKKKNAVFNT